MSKTIVEKILSRASGVDAHAGQIVTAPVDVMFCHDGNRPLGAEVFDTYGASKVCDAKRVIQIMPRRVQRRVWRKCTPICAIFRSVRA